MDKNRLTVNDLKNNLERLNIQRSRVFRAVSRLKKDYSSNRNYLHHDLDYYFIMARRLYRVIEELAKSNSKVANIKGNKEYGGLYKKIKIRDHSEHPPTDFDQFPSISPGSPIKMVNSVSVNKNGVIVYSGSETWDIKNDHKRFTELIETVKNLLIA